MRFKIHRASDCLSKGKPCDEAIAVEYQGSGGKYVEWEVEINTLAELVAFSEKHGDLVFDPESIWIYDSYME